METNFSEESLSLEYVYPKPNYYGWWVCGKGYDLACDLNCGKAYCNCKFLRQGNINQEQK